jgi:DNA-binding GntR family transcriptional regulator
MINNLMLRTRRYEVALFRETQPIQVANDEHEKIILAIKNQELERAAKLLRQNLTSGKKPILDWLESRSKH